MDIEKIDIAVKLGNELGKLNRVLDVIEARDLNVKILLTEPDDESDVFAKFGDGAAPYLVEMLKSYKSDLEDKIKAL